MSERGYWAAAPASLRVGVMTVAVALLAGCNGRIGNARAGSGGGGPITTGTGGAGVPSGTGGGAGPVPCTPEPATAQCTGTEVQASKRTVRLTFNQIAESIRALLGDAIADKIIVDFEIVDARHRWFPPLANPREGTVITDSPWDTGDRMAQEAAQYVFDNFGTVTGCTGTNVTDTCAQNFVRGFATKAYRRPLDATETTELNKVYTDVKGFGGTIQDATQYGVYAVLDSPLFLYRTEFGGGVTAAGALSQHELASALSYFLTDGPPDATLTTAAAQSQLSTDAQLRAQVDRIIATDAARRNLHGAMMSYFDITNLEDVIVDRGANPSWNEAVRNSMYRESELFLANVLWTGKLTDLILSRRSPINEALAPIYGVSWPPAGVPLDADGFGVVELPATRAGMLTQGGFLVARARPMSGSVIGRGLLVNAAFLCIPAPPFPTALGPAIEEAKELLADATEREKAAFRADRSRACAACHPNFDPFGLTLENFDGIGQYRTNDDKGRPIDASVVLPPRLGCAPAANAVEMAAVLGKGTAFASCFAKNVLSFALAENASTAAATSCATQAIVDRFVAAGEGTFTSLVREIAVSQTMSARNPGGTP
jgi:hypothetical protein